MRLVHGFGINDKSCPIKDKDRKLLKEYNMWRNMIARCHRKDVQERQPTYINCEISKNFKYYHLFYKWYHSQIGCNTPNAELDKDLIFKGNKIYSEDNCLLLPDEINVFLTKRESLRGLHPVGVHFHKPLNKYRAQINKNKKKIHLGYFSDTNSAFNAYKVQKEMHAKELAEKYRDHIDSRAYYALMSYIVEITD